MSRRDSPLPLSLVPHWSVFTPSLASPTKPVNPWGLSHPELASHRHRQASAGTGGKPRGRTPPGEAASTRGELQIPLKGESCLLFREGSLVSKEPQTTQQGHGPWAGEGQSRGSQQGVQNSSIGKSPRGKQTVLSQWGISFKSLLEAVVCSCHCCDRKAERRPRWGQGQSRRCLCRAVCLSPAPCRCPCLRVVTQRTDS